MFFKRKSKAIGRQGKPAVLLSVKDVLHILQVCKNLSWPKDNEVFYSYLSTLYDDIELLVNINQSFFNPELSIEEKIKKQKREKLGIEEQGVLISDSYTSLLKECEIYTRWGHPNLLNYSWDYFLIVRRHFEEANKK